MKNKFKFYEVVKISSRKPKLSFINGRIGVVRGMSQSEEAPFLFCYAVDILDSSGELEEGWSIFEEDLISLNKFAKEEDFYTGESVKVRVNPETGEGEIVDDNE